jgi:hypothetical protein
MDVEKAGARRRRPRIRISESGDCRRRPHRRRNLLAPTDTYGFGFFWRASFLLVRIVVLVALNQFVLRLLKELYGVILVPAKVNSFLVFVVLLCRLNIMDRLRGCVIGFLETRMVYVVSIRDRRDEN